MPRKGKRTRNETPQKQALREFMTSYLKENDMTIQDGNDVNSIMRDMMSIILEGALDEEMEKNWAIPNMIIAIGKQTTVEMDIQERPFIPLMVICRLIFRGTDRATLNQRSSKNIRIL